MDKCAERNVDPEQLLVKSSFLGFERIPQYPDVGRKLRARRQALPGARWPTGTGMKLHPETGGMTIGSEKLLASL
jgi:hypothetical protein